MSPRTKGLRILPACSPTCLLACLPAHLLACLPARQLCDLIYVNTSQGFLSLAASNQNTHPFLMLAYLSDAISILPSLMRHLINLKSSAIS
jgi:hypothetical protein